MAKNAHVPKFGNWEGDNIPYTRVFENVNKDKGHGPKNFNPNDPAQNPDAFVSGIFPLELEVKNESSAYALVMQQPNKYGSKKDVDVRQAQGYRKPPMNNRPYRGANLELPVRIKSQEDGISSRFGSDKSSSSSSDTSNSHRRHSRRLTRYSDDDDSFRVPLPPTPPRPSTQKPGRFAQRDYVVYDMPSSVQNFGSWDGKDSKSDGGGFTEIFNKAKREMQVTASKLPKVPADQIVYPGKQKSRTKPSRRSKLVCCIRPASSD